MRLSMGRIVLSEEGILTLYVTKVQMQYVGSKLKRL
jgi:hypothetical protein